METIRQFVFVGPRLGLNRESDGRLGKGDLGKVYRMRFVSKTISGERSLELGHRANIACVQLANVHCRFPLHYRQVR